MLFSFVGAGDSICPGVALYYVPRGWVGESPLVRDAHLFVLQVYESSLELASGEKWSAAFPVQWGVGRLSMG
jgi:hypothetical protein